MNHVRKQQGGPWLRLASLVVFVVTTLGLACSDDRSNAPLPESASATTVHFPTCRPPSAPPAYRLVDVLPGVFLDRPLSLSRVGADYLVASQAGRVTRVSASGDTWTSATLLDVTDKLAETEGESGLIGFVASPDYETLPEVFVAYTGRSSDPSSVFRTVVARMSSLDGGRTIDPSTEEILFAVERDSRGHNGGRLLFGPDRHLYIGLGDGSWGDPERRAQDPHTLFGKILRVDVLGKHPYASPPDNPFVDGGGRAEVFAYGIRNPWSFSFDPAGRLWLGDVGHERYEEIDIVTKGGNYGWPLREGSHCFTASPCEVPGAVDPIFEYPHVDGYSVVGGYVYRGQQPKLAGAYVFADFMTGRIWAIDANAPGEARTLLDSGRNIVAFGEDEDGELLLVDYAGQVLRLVATSSDATASKVTLGSLDCLDETRRTAYDVNSPLWSDGLDKRRWFSLPEGQSIIVDADESLALPIGAILLKEFSSHGRRIETRMLARDETDGWLGYTFEWNAEQTDAVLIDDAKTVEVDGAPWTLPSRSQCFACHRRSVGSLLGFTPPQLDRGRQLDELAERGVLNRPVDRTRFSALAAPDDPTRSVEDRARSYLSANCSFCHGGAGSPEGVIDLRAFTPLSKTYAVCRLGSGSFDGAEALAPSTIIVPGDPASSILVARMNRTETGRMPPIGRSRIDTAAVDLVSSWITTLSDCP